MIDKKGIQLTGIARERALIGNKIIEQFFQEATYSETDKRLTEVLSILEAIQGEYEHSITGALEVIRYAQSYATYVKN